MKVLKFGGTSVGSIASLTNVKKIVEGENDRVIVIVSALGGITDQLLKTANIAVNGELQFNFVLVEICCRHLDIIDALVPEYKRVIAKDRIFQMTEQLRQIYREISQVKQISQHSLDTLVSFGERMSSSVIAEIIEDAVLVDSREFIKVKLVDNRQVLNEELTDQLIHDTFDNIDFKVVIAPGFIAANESGETTNLGRGGSDYTAAILAAALDASMLEIWTDVDGFMTADPKIVANAPVIDRLSYSDAMTLCDNGAKVIYPPTIRPVYQKHIPILIKNTFNPSAPGTLISDDFNSRNQRRFKGISYTKNTSLVSLPDTDSTELATVSVIGENMDQGEVTSLIMNAVDSIPISVKATFASAACFTIVIDKSDLHKAINLIHDQLL